MSKSKDMPTPQVIDYYNFYKVTPLFKNDLKKILKDVAYVDAKKYIDEIESKDIVPIAVLNEFIRKLSMLPYKVISPMMAVIENKENFVKYFEPMEKQHK